MRANTTIGTLFARVLSGFCMEGDSMTMRMRALAVVTLGLLAARADATIIRLTQQGTIEGTGEIATLTALLHTDDVFPESQFIPYTGHHAGYVDPFFGFDLFDVTIDIAGTTVLKRSSGRFSIVGDLQVTNYYAAYTFRFDGGSWYMPEAVITGPISQADIESAANPAAHVLLSHEIWNDFHSDTSLRLPGLPEIRLCVSSRGNGSPGCVDGTLSVVEVPEPGTMALLCIGMLGIGMSGQRVKSKDARRIAG